VGHRILPPVRSADDGSLARRQALPDQAAIHDDLLAHQPRAVKRQPGQIEPC
jgi:hypothetical protein